MRYNDLPIVIAGKITVDRFRWAELKLQSLRRIRTQRDILLALSEIPRPLSDLYDQLYYDKLEETWETDTALFHNTLKWMLSATQVFAWVDFSRAITSFLDLDIDDINQDMILDLLANFVVFDTAEDGNHVFRFAHLSVREFLETRPEYTNEICNTFTASVCLLHLIGACGTPQADGFLRRLDLQLKDNATFSSTDSYKKGLLDYSLRKWNLHCVQAQERNRANTKSYLSQLLFFFLFDDSGPNCPLNFWVRSRQRKKMESRWGVHLLGLITNYQEPRDRGFLLSCVFGFGEILRMDQYHELGDDVKEQCIMAAAFHGQYDILQFLATEKKDQALQKRILSALIHNRDIESLRRFLTHVEPSLITDAMVVVASRESKDIMYLLLEHNKDIQITAKLIEDCAHFFEDIEGLLDCAPDVAITPGILTQCVGSIGIDTLRNILNKNDSSIITCEAIAELAYLGHGSETSRLKMELLLDRAGPMETRESAMARALHDNPSSAMVKMLVDHGWPVNQNIIQYAAQWGISAPFKILLDSGGHLTAEVVARSARNLRDGPAMVQLVVSLMDHALDDDAWLQMMLQCAGNTWGNPETLQVLLGMKPGLKIPQRHLIAFTENSIKGNINLEVILDDQREMELSDAVIEKAIRNLDFDETVPKLLDRHGLARITNQMLLAAVSNRRFGDEMTRLLLSRGAKVEQPTSEITEAIIKNVQSGYEILQMLENRFGPFDFNATHVTAAASGSLNMLRLVVKRCSVTEVGPSILVEAAGKGSLPVMKHLLTLASVAVSEEMLIAASGNDVCTTDMLKFLWPLAHDVEVCPGMFTNAADKWHRETTDFSYIFSRVQDSKTCQRILNGVMSTKDILDDSSYTPILELILDSEFEVELTHEMIMAAFAARHGSVLKTFLEHEVEIKLTQDMVDKAVDLKDYSALHILLKHGSTRELNLEEAKIIVDNEPLYWL